MYTGISYVAIATRLEVGIDGSGPVLVLLQSPTGAEIVCLRPTRTSQRLRGLLASNFTNRCEDGGREAFSLSVFATTRKGGTRTPLIPAGNQTNAAGPPLVLHAPSRVRYQTLDGECYQNMESFRTGTAVERRQFLSSTVFRPRFLNQPDRRNNRGSTFLVPKNSMTECAP